MLREFARQTPLLTLPIASFVLFLAIFALVLVTTFRRRAQAFDPVARLPLADGDPKEESNDERP